MHFYSQKGEPRHFVEMKTRPGELRPTRVTDARKHGWIPSVTTILNVLNKPALINWKVDQHLIQAFTTPRTFDPMESWISDVKRRTELEMNKAPSAGTDIHNSLEAFFLGNLGYEHEHFGLCCVVNARIQDKTGLFTWTPECRFTHSIGFAGMVDLHGENWVIDFKTKQTADKFKPGKMAFPDHHRQLAAYREGLRMPNARCANVFICIENCEVDFHEYKEEDLQKGWATFCDALNIWKRENYDSSF